MAALKRPLVAVIPAHNEEGRVGRVARGAAAIADWVVAVDDGSADRTLHNMLSTGGRNVVALRLPTNCGKGAAMRAAFRYARSALGAKTVIALDADGQHDPREMRALISAFERGNYDLLVGCRSGRDGRMPLVKRLGNCTFRGMSRLLFGVTVSDPLSGFRIFGGRALGIEWKSPGYSVEMEVLAEAARRGLKVGECPVSTIYNDKYKGTDVLSGARIMLDMAKWRVFGW